MSIDKAQSKRIWCLVPAQVWNKEIKSIEYIGCLVVWLMTHRFHFWYYTLVVHRRCVNVTINILRHQADYLYDKYETQRVGVIALSVSKLCADCSFCASFSCFNRIFIRKLIHVQRPHSHSLPSKLAANWIDSFECDVCQPIWLFHKCAMRDAIQKGNENNRKLQQQIVVAELSEISNSYISYFKHIFFALLFQIHFQWMALVTTKVTRMQLFMGHVSKISWLTIPFE